MQNGYPLLYFTTLLYSIVSDTHLTTIIISLIVSGCWLFFIYKLDFFQREKWQHILAVFGLASIFTLFCFPVYDYLYIVQNTRLTGEPSNDLFYTIFVIGLTEEIVKFLPWIIFGYYFKKLREPFDYILYASIAALGFAFFENTIYLEDLNNITVRFLTAVLSHMFDASIVAFSFVLMRYKYHSKQWRYLLPIAGILIASTLHGLYDFFILNPVYESTILTILSYLVGLHAWFYFTNVSINRSPQFRKPIPFQKEEIKFIIVILVLSIFMFEHMLTSIEYGTYYGNYILFHYSVYIGLFLVYFIFQIQQLEFTKGAWRKKFFVLPSIFKFGKSNNSTSSNEDISGLHLNLFCSKSNQYIGHEFPKSGVCIRKINIQNSPNWYLFYFNTPLKTGNYLKDTAIIRTDDFEASLLDDKVEILFFLLPNTDILNQSMIETKDLLYVGRVYSRPIY